MTTFTTFIQARDFLLKHRENYALAYQNFSWPKLKQFNWALDYFDVMAKNNDKTALWLVNEKGDEIKLSFAELSERSNRIANFLRNLGVKRGDSILIMLNNVVPLWESMLAVMKLGAVMVPTTTLLNAGDLSDRIERGQIKHLLVDANETSKFANLSINCTKISVGKEINGWIPFTTGYQASTVFLPDKPTEVTEPLLLYFTSGTTTKPKLVEHTHQSYPIGHLSTMYWLGVQPGDIHWNISSPGWGKHAWSNFFAPWNVEATVFVYQYSRFNAKNVLNILTNYHITTMCAPPTVWRMLIQQNLADYPVKIRELCSAGEPLNAEIIEQIQRAWGITTRDGYGQTETTAQLGNSPGQPVKPGSMGKPLPGYKVELLDAEDIAAQEGEIGLNLDSIPVGLMSGYRDFEERTAEAMRNNYYHTGDVARRDSDGYYIYVGRVDDLFKASDYLISPFEIESILLKHDAIIEAAVVPSPDPLRLAVPKAFITIKNDCQPNLELAKSIFNHVQQYVSPYKRIRRIEFMDLPKTISGKIRRAELREVENMRRIHNESRQVLEFWEEDIRS